MHVVVLNWNGRRRTLTCVESLLASGYEDCHVLVVDNGSSDGSVAAFADAWGQEARVTMVENPENLGYAGGNNVGFRHALDAGAERVFVLNNDTVVDPGALELLVDALDRDPGLGMVGPKVLDLARPERLGSSFDRIRLWCFGALPTTMGRVDRGQFDHLRELDLLTGCAMLLRAETLRELEGFDRDYFAYYEEVDLAIRMRRGGWRIGFVPGAIVRHEGGGSTGGNRPLVHYYKLRNYILLMRKNARWYHFLTFVPIAAAVSVVRLGTALVTADFARFHALCRALAWHVGITRDWRPGG